MPFAPTDDNVMHRTGVFLSLLPPLRADRRLAMLFVVVSTVIFLVSAPFALPPAAIPVRESQSGRFGQPVG